MNLWSSDTFRQTFQNAFVFTGIAVFFKVWMGIALALLLNEQLWFKRMIRGAVLLPWVIPTALSTLGVVVDVQLALQRGQLDGDRPGRHGPAGAQLARPEVLRHGRGHHRQHLARPALLRHQHPRRARGHPQGALRGGRGRRRRRQRPLLAHHPAPAQAGACGGGALLDHLHVQRLQHRLRADARGPINSTHLFATLSRVLGIDTGRIGEGAAVSLYLFPLLVFVVWAQLRFVRKQVY